MHITIPPATHDLPPALFDWMTGNGVDVRQISGANLVTITDRVVAGTTVLGSPFEHPITIPMDDYLASWLLERYWDPETTPEDRTTAAPIDDMASLVEQLRSAREDEKNAKDRANEARDQILARLRQMQADVGTVDGRPAVGVKRVVSNRLDTARLRREQPDIADIYTSESTSERLELL